MSDITTIDLQLRPKNLAEYIGQENAVNALQLFLSGIKKRGYVAEHLLFHGPPGLGKTTLAHIVASELGGELKITSGPAIEKAGDLAAILTNLNDNDVLFIDEIHRLSKSIEEILYPVLEEYVLDIIIGKGPAARSVRLPIPKVTIVGATTRIALLSATLRDRFGLILRLNPYELDSLVKIVKRSANMVNLPISDEAALAIAKRSRHTPRIANRILKRVRDLFDVHSHKIIDEKMVNELFELLSIDEKGLNELDNLYIQTLIEKFEGGPVGLTTISTAMNEDKQTLEEYIEPYLIQVGLLRKTPKGRVASPTAFTHFNIADKKIVSEKEKLV